MNIDLLALPIVGAFIGYFTNYIAIKMLFLPKKAYFIFNIRIPLTPGLIPKKRKNLIDKISNVVSSKVVNKKDIIKYIYKKKNRTFLYQFSKNLIDSVLLRKISTLNLNYTKIEQYLYDFIDNNLDTIIKDRLSTFNIDIDYFVHNAFLRIDKQKSLRNYISQKNLNSIENFINQLSIQALSQLSLSMDSPEIKELVKNKITEAINRYADGSNILMASIISMISPLIEDNEKVANIIIKEIKAILADETMQKKVSENVYKAFQQELLNKDLEHISIKLGFGSIEKIQSDISEKIKEIFDSLSIKDKIIDGAISGIDKHELSRYITDKIKLLAQKYTFFDIANIMMPQIIEKLPSMAVNNLLYIVKRESEQIFNFDIAKIAKERLDKLDISDIENVVLNISKDQFTHINIFGGLLGFIIGLIEVLIGNGIHF